MNEIPLSVQQANEIVDLAGFLEDVCVGFHWDILDRLEDGIYVLDRHRRIMYWSRGAERITGYRTEEVLGRCCADNILKHVDSDGIEMCRGNCPVSATLASGEPCSAEVFLHHKNGYRVPVHVYCAPIRNTEGQIIGAFETFAETTALLAPLERVRQLEQIAYLDPLTGVANRRCLGHEILRRLDERSQNGWRFGLVLVDVDHFKNFNDRYGHETGDRVLQMVAQTLAHNCRSHDLVGRWGGEEFLIIASPTDAADLMRFAERSRALVAASTLDVDGQQLRVTISAGAVVAQPGDDPHSLVSRADALLYESKTAGRNRVTMRPGMLQACSAGDQ